MRISFWTINLPEDLLIATGIAFFLMFILISFLSWMEKEYRASLRAALLSIIVSFPYLINALVKFPFQYFAGWILLSLTFLTIFPLLVPFKGFGKLSEIKPVERLDERITMFSRNELKEGTKLFEEFYKKNPEKFNDDSEFRKLPGLLSGKALYADPVIFAASDAYFEVCKVLRNGADEKPSERKYDIDSKDISVFIKKNAINMGAHSVGVTELRDYHLYSVGGRGERYNRVYSEESHKFAIAFTVEMDHDMIGMGPDAPTVMESARCYQHAADIAVLTAKMIRNLGYSASAHIDGYYKVVCPLVARDAGLGEIGRMGLLITPKLGPRVRISVVTTDMPVKTDKRNFDPTVTEFCEVCKKCAVVCPSKAISKEPRKKIKGVLRWQIDQEKCFTYWCKVGTDCGRCVAVCPYSHPDNLFHNSIRFFLKRSYFFRKVAAFMDDFLYGKKPKPVKVAKWLKVKVR